MTEKIKSEDVSVEALATPYRAILKTDYYVLREMFDKFWSENGLRLANSLKYKGKKGKNGSIDLNKAKESIETTYPVVQIYSKVLADFVVNTLNEEFKEEPKYVLFLSDLDLHSFDENAEPVIVSVFYFWPELTFKNDIDFNLKREVERDFEKAFEKRCLELAEKNKDPETGVCPSIDDESIYKSVGAESKESFRSSFEAQYNSYMDNSDSHFAFDHVIDQVLKGATLEAVPQRFIDMNVENFLSRYLKQFNGNMSTALKSVGANDEKQMKRMAEGQVYREIVNQMAINWYAKKFGVANTREAVASDILSKIVWVN